MRLQKPRQHQALFTIYAFCRALDDIADRDGPRDLKQRELETWRSRIDAIYAAHHLDDADAEILTLPPSPISLPNLTFHVRRLMRSSTV